MKRTIPVIAILALSLCLSACGGKTPSAASSAAPSAVKSAAVSAQKTAKTADGTEMTTEFWTLNYSKDWTFDKDNDLSSSEGSYASATLKIEENGEQKEAVTISANVADTNDYRKEIKNAGIDAYELIEKKSVKTTQLGGIDCVEGNRSGDVYYSGRDEKAGVTVNVEIAGEADDKRVTELLSTLKFTLKDKGNTDPPWPWNGTAFSTDAKHSQMSGEYTVSADWLKFSDPVITDDIFSGRIAAYGNTVYVLLDGKLKEYSREADGIKFVKDLPVNDDNYKYMSIDENGVLYLSGFMTDLISIKDGQKALSLSGTSYVTMDSSGTWGISWFPGSAPKRITISNNTLQMTDWNIAETTLISSVSISKNHIFVAGSGADKQHYVFVYDLNGSLQMTLGGKEIGQADALGSVTSVIETANGFMAFDGNMRTVVLWKADGTVIGAIKAEELFGTNYPWMSDALLLPDGNILSCMCQERDDESADELLIYSLSGF